MRLIDADALIKIIENTYLEGDSKLSFRVDGATEDTLIGKFQTIDIISDMPTVCDIEWIPVSERLPTPRETENMIAKYYLIQNEYGDMMVARYVGKGWEQMYQHDYIEDKVVAWMPLPKPYEPQESEDNE